MPSRAATRAAAISRRHGSASTAPAGTAVGRTGSTVTAAIHCGLAAAAVISKPSRPRRASCRAIRAPSRAVAGTLHTGRPASVPISISDGRSLDASGSAYTSPPSRYSMAAVAA